jgi:K+/H+ antiporter YhaU regulatory subunit KhtT
MGKDVRIVELPGIGRKYEIGGQAPGHRVAVIAHRDGHKELYVFDRVGEEPSAVVVLNEKQARKLGAVLAETYETD